MSLGKPPETSTPVAAERTPMLAVPVAAGMAQTHQEEPRLEKQIPAAVAVADTPRHKPVGAASSF